MTLFLGKVQLELYSKQQHPGINEVHQGTSRWPHFWSSSERTVCHVSGSGTQVEFKSLFKSQTDLVSGHWQTSTSSGIGDAENVRHESETTGKETTAPKCRDGNSEKGVSQWHSRTFGRLVRWSNLLPYCLRFWKMDSLFKASLTNALK